MLHQLTRQESPTESGTPDQWLGGMTGELCRILRLYLQHS
jgi:hypothetical protein